MLTTEDLRLTDFRMAVVHWALQVNFITLCPTSSTDTAAETESRINSPLLSAGSFERSGLVDL
jgi:hypothetical protein